MYLEFLDFLVPGFVGCLVFEQFYGPVVDLLDDGIKFGLCEVLETGLPRQVSANHAVAILVGSPLVEAIGISMVGGHAQQVVWILAFEPVPDQFGAPSLPENVQHLGAEPAGIHAPRLAPIAASRYGPALRGQRAIERSDRICSRLQIGRPVWPVRLVPVGREPAVTPQLPAHRGLRTPDRYDDLSK